MGCGTSKLDDLEAVKLCRDRSKLLADAISCRYLLADAHENYSRSLRSVGESLHRFLEGFEKLHAPASPRLPLPAQRKGEDLGSNSNAGSHIHFHSDDEDDGESFGSDDDLDLHSDGDSPVLHHLHEKPVETTTVSYAKNQPPNPSVLYELRAISPEKVHFGGVGEASSSYSYYGHSSPPQNPSFYPYSYGYGSNYNGNYGEMGGYFASFSPPVGMPPAGVHPGPENPKTVVPPPPSPPKVSGWDFLNPFENYESYFAPYTPSRSSREVREEEGIPDLEDEESEVVHGKNVSSSGSSPDLSKGDKISEVGDESPQLQKSVDAGPSEENVDSCVDKNVIVSEVQEPKNVATLPLKRYHDWPEVVQEIKSQFNRASESAVELSKMLEVGKQPYHQRNLEYKGE